jgi:exodeoxyribonuclease X
MSAIIFDTETTGSNEPQIIEAAWLLINLNLEQLDSYEERFKPSKPIELGAMATHHIIDEELIFERPHTEFELPSHVNYIIGHNIDYDWKVSGEPDVKRIDTLALARAYFPEFDSHTQSALMYAFYKDTAKIALKNAHSALADVMNCRLVLLELIKRLPRFDSWESLWLISEEARIPINWPFGKYRGQPINGSDYGYRKWALTNMTDLDPYTRKAIENSFKRT